MITSIRFVTSNPSINLLMNTKIGLWVHLDGSHKCTMTIDLIDYQCVSNKLHHKRWRSIVDWYHSFHNYYKNNDVHDTIHGLSNIIHKCLCGQFLIWKNYNKPFMLSSYSFMCFPFWSRQNTLWQPKSFCSSHHVSHLAWPCSTYLSHDWKHKAIHF
jgi:hypothetical protein